MPTPEGIINDEHIRALVKIYTRAIDKITKDFNSSTTFEKSRRVALLKNVRRILLQLGKQMDGWADENIRDYYVMGVEEAERTLKKANIQLDEKLPNFTLVDSRAVAALTEEVKLGFAESMQGMMRGARRLLSEAEKLEINAILTEGVISGETRRRISLEIRDLLEKNGISAFTDKRGREWTLDAYTRMLVRTKVAEARNTGLGNRQAQYGFDLVEVSNHNSLHKACRVWEGKILSYTGKTKGYPTLAQAKNAGLFHPNCEHAINTLTELSGLTEPYDNPFNKLGNDDLGPDPRDTTKLIRRY